MGAAKAAGDADFIEVEPSTSGDELLRVAGEGSEIDRTRGLHFHCVTVAQGRRQALSAQLVSR